MSTGRAGEFVAEETFLLFSELTAASSQPFFTLLQSQEFDGYDGER